MAGILAAWGLIDVLWKPKKEEEKEKEEKGHMEAEGRETGWEIEGRVEKRGREIGKGIGPMKWGGKEAQVKARK